MADTIDNFIRAGSMRESWRDRFQNKWPAMTMMMMKSESEIDYPNITPCPDFSIKSPSLRSWPSSQQDTWTDTQTADHAMTDEEASSHTTKKGRKRSKTCRCFSCVLLVLSVLAAACAGIGLSIFLTQPQFGVKGRSRDFDEKHVDVSLTEQEQTTLTQTFCNLVLKLLKGAHFPVDKGIKTCKAVLRVMKDSERLHVNTQVVPMDGYSLKEKFLQALSDLVKNRELSHDLDLDVLKNSTNNEINMIFAKTGGFFDFFPELVNGSLVDDSDKTDTFGTVKVSVTDVKSQSTTMRGLEASTKAPSNNHVRTETVDIQEKKKTTVKVMANKQNDEATMVGVEQSTGKRVDQTTIRIPGLTKPSKSSEGILVHQASAATPESTKPSKSSKDSFANQLSTTKPELTNPSNLSKDMHDDHTTTTQTFTKPSKSSKDTRSSTTTAIPGLTKPRRDNETFDVKTTPVTNPPITLSGSKTSALRRFHDTETFVKIAPTVSVGKSADDLVPSNTSPTNSTAGTLTNTAGTSTNTAGTSTDTAETSTNTNGTSTHTAEKATLSAEPKGTAAAIPTKQNTESTKYTAEVKLVTADATTYSTEVSTDIEPISTTFDIGIGSSTQKPVTTSTDTTTGDILPSESEPTTAKTVQSYQTTISPIVGIPIKSVKLFEVNNIGAINRGVSLENKTVEKQGDRDVVAESLMSGGVFRLPMRTTSKFKFLFSSGGKANKQKPVDETSKPPKTVVVVRNRNTNVGDKTKRSKI